MIDRITRRPSSGSGGPPNESPRLERCERRSHRLRADLLEPGEGGRCRRAAAVEPRERRALGQREFVPGGDLTQSPQKQADAQPERRGKLVVVELFDDFISLT